MTFMEHALYVTTDAKARLGNKITVQYIPTEYKPDEITWDFVCQHPSSHREGASNNYMTFAGPAQYETSVDVCDDCEEVLDQEYGDLA